ncbi:hypothetical protein Bca52824_034292 [Brassica carinata]|uniref:Uncharacterized protein n=1 Tax=Brassica carinata TaxID=52824 RepID=A0A8X7S2W9_BRACI|nr:hypothetical protein Bca52824_034292 [Brassica carinata]
MEFLLKLSKRMHIDEHLSVQDFINYMHKNLLDCDGALVVDASLVVSILKEKGMLLEKDCPLSESFNRTLFEDVKNRPRFFAKEVTMHKLYDDESSKVTPQKYDAFHVDLIQHLKWGVVAVGLTVYPSYAKLKVIMRRCALIYVNGECEAEALKLDGSDMGGRILTITAYPFDDNRLEHVFAPTKATDKYRQRTLKVTGFDTSLSKDDIKKMLRGVFPGSGCFPFMDGSAFLYLRGQDAMDKALKLSGGSVGGFKFAVTAVLPIRVLKCGFSLASMLAMVEKAKPTLCEGNQKKIKTTEIRVVRDMKGKRDQAPDKSGPALYRRL